VFADGCYLVQIQTEGLERKSLLQWWKKISIKQLTRTRR
jgi:hypothetical protein